MDAFNKLAEMFTRFPGIGPRQAKRFVYFLLSAQNGFREELARLLIELRRQSATCASCKRFFVPVIGKELCAICADINRDYALLMIVEKDIDLENIERSHAYRGAYFVLGGTIPILEKNPSERVRLKELERIISARAKSGLKEVIMAISLTAEGENTAEYIVDFLKESAERENFKLTKLGRGLSTGSELEYSDPETIKNAFMNRQ